MHDPRRTVAAAILAVLIGIGTATAAALPPDLGPALARAAAAPGPSQGQELNLLFIQQASSGSIVMDANNSTSGTLTLRGVARHTVWFADRPGRSAGQVETAYFAGRKFMDKAGDWLSKPNAALYASNPGPNPNNDTIIIVTLASPVYNATLKTMTYRVDIVPATSSMLSEGGPRTSNLLKSYVQTASDPNTPIVISELLVPVMNFDSVVMFIDHWGWWGGGGGGWWGWHWCGWGWGWCWGW